MEPATQTGRSAAGARNNALLVVVLAALWMTFSGKTDALHLGYGVLSIFLVVLLSRGLVVSRSRPEENEAIARMSWPRALLYPWWLVVQVVIANVQVTWIIIRPDMPIDPVLLRFRTGMKTSLAKVVLGNSITLTPGTFTVRVEDDCFLVHTIHESLASGLLDGSMQRKVSLLFGETIPDDLQISVIRDPEAVRREVLQWSS